MRLLAQTNRLASVFIPLFLAACAAPPKVAVQERQTVSQQQEVDRIGGALLRIVQPGDTLHGISFALGLDPNQVAAWNDIEDTDSLPVGKRLRLTKPINFKPKSIKPESPRISSKPGSQQRASKAIVKKPSTNVPKVSKRPDTSWVWPTNGQVVSRFRPAAGKQGIDIAGKSGQVIRAALPGEVVYAGNSLKGYGNLLIIKHSNRYLSAYAYNQKLHVNEGQRVEKNSLIATMGMDKNKRSVLHFQIREYGKPLNPLNFLPSP